MRRLFHSRLENDAAFMKAAFIGGFQGNAAATIGIMHGKHNDKVQTLGAIPDSGVVLGIIEHHT